MSLDLGKPSLEETTKKKASYAAIRLDKILDEHLTVKKGVPEDVTLLQINGFGLRVIVNGARGFAGSVDLNKKEVTETTHKAVSIASAGSKLKKNFGV